MVNASLDRPQSKKNFRDDSELLDLPNNLSASYQKNKRRVTEQESERSASFIEEISHGSNFDQIPAYQDRTSKRHKAMTTL